MSVDFAEIFADWLPHVARWVRALGVADDEVEGVTEQVFSQGRRGLREFDGVSPSRWLYGLAARQVTASRRRRWPARAIAYVRDRRWGTRRAGGEMRLQALLAGMPAALRAAFVLFEIEGYAPADIAEMQGVAPREAWARIADARRRLFTALTQRRLWAMGGRPSCSG
jgi:DNA-directed RNA polymerase specialized sigma24 family protein